MKRKPPENAELYAWKKFERWADANGVGDHPDDWSPNWMCWKTAYIAGVNQS